EPDERAGVAVCLRDVPDAAEPSERSTSCVLRRIALPDVVLGCFFEVAGDFVAELVVEASRTSEIAQACDEDSQPPHDALSRILKNRATIPVVFCHASSSARSCRRPAGVSL